MSPGRPYYSLVADLSRFQFTDESVPRLYDAFLVPRLFHPWAEALVERAGIGPGQRVLDVATGPGTVARVAAARVGLSGRVAAVDLTPGMLALARTKPPVPGGAAIEYAESPAAPLAQPDASFDVVTCQQGLQFFPDQPAALAEMRRVLVAAGRLALSVWRSIEQCTPFAAFHRSLRVAGHAELAKLLTTPFPVLTGERLVRLVQGAGFGDITVVEEERELTFEGGVEQALAGFSGTPLGPHLARLPPEEHRRIVEAAQREFRPLLHQGAVRGPMRSWVLTARA